MQSMTGYAESSFSIEGNRIFFRIRSLNSRFLETGFFFPTDLQWFQLKAAEKIQEKFKRGKFEIFIESESALPKTPRLDEKLLREYQQVFRGIYNKKNLQLPVESLVHLPGLFEIAPYSFREHESKLDLYFMRALVRLEKARKKEGKKILQFMRKQVRLLARNNQKIIILHQRFQKKEKNIIQKKILSLLRREKDNRPLMSLSPQGLRRFWSEVKEDVLLRFQADITEEFERLQMHLPEVLKLLDSEAPSGKKIEFYLQEIQREVNTLTSKTRDPDINAIGIDMKVIVEQLREQVRNVE